MASEYVEVLLLMMDLIKKHETCNGLKACNFHIFAFYFVNTFVLCIVNLKGIDSNNNRGYKLTAMIISSVFFPSLKRVKDYHDNTDDNEKKKKNYLVTITDAD